MNELKIAPAVVEVKKGDLDTRARFLVSILKDPGYDPDVVWITIAGFGAMAYFLVDGTEFIAGPNDYANVPRGIESIGVSFDMKGYPEGSYPFTIHGQDEPPFVPPHN